jgi:hypothetical protein
LENFEYDNYKELYARIWNVVFDFYFEVARTDSNIANQGLNSAINILSIIFLRPVYKIWYMYQYRLAAVVNIQSMDLQTLAAENTGLEHLAGVRRGETFLLVRDSAQAGEIVVADFNLPSFTDCSCECTPCNEENKSRVSPFQKPIIMVIDPVMREQTTFTEGANILKIKASLDENEKYVLELDSMGFYKGDSKIDEFVEITYPGDDGAEFQELEGKWIDKGKDGEKMILTFPSRDFGKDFAIKLHYTLRGDFYEQAVQGNVYLIIIGPREVYTYDVATADAHVYSYYPYAEEAVKDDNPEMTFNGTTETRTIGNTRMEVYKSALGNEYTITKDKDGLPYVEAINVTNPGVDIVPFTLKTDNSSTSSVATMNVIDKTDKLESSTVSGVIKSSDGTPLQDAKLVTSSGKEVITNDKGEYLLKGIKSGEIVTVEKEGFQARTLQVNSQTPTAEVQMERTELIQASTLNKVDPSGKLSTISSNINKAVFTNFMK